MSIARVSHRDLARIVGKRHAQTVVTRVPKARRTLDGIVFDSKDEMERYAVLRAEQRAGIIRNLRCQVRFELEHAAIGPLLIRSEGYPHGRRAHYTADFVYERRSSGWNELAWHEVIEERKTGPDDAASRLRRAVFEWISGKRVTVTAGRNKARRR